MEDDRLLPSELSEKYDKVGEWGEHPDYGLWDWLQEVASRTTRRGYWDWVYCKLHKEYVVD